MNYYNISSQYMRQVMKRIQNRFTPDEARQLDRMLQVVGEELMPEVDLKSCGDLFAGPDQT